MRKILILFLLAAPMVFCGCMDIMRCMRDVGMLAKRRDQPRNWKAQLEAMEEGSRLCPHCKGHGTCWYCDGSGTVVDVIPVCGRCRGSGVCGGCGGSGKIYR